MMHFQAEHLENKAEVEGSPRGGVHHLLVRNKTIQNIPKCSDSIYVYNTSQQSDIAPLDKI